MSKPRITTDSAARKAIPLASGCLDYFPDALAAVAELSHAGNEKHNPGQPLHWARSKSTDEADCLIRHFVERGTVDTDGIRHSVKVAWRALALLQKELEQANGLPISRGSREDLPAVLDPAFAAKLDAAAAAIVPSWVEPDPFPAEVLPRVVDVSELRVGDRVRVSYAEDDTPHEVITVISRDCEGYVWLDESLGSDDNNPGRTIILLERAP